MIFRWLSRRQLIMLFWLGALITVAVKIHSGPAWWDIRIYGNALEWLRHGLDPYAAGIMVQQAFHNRHVASPPAPPPYTYVYSPLTLPLLRLLAVLPIGLAAGLYVSAVVAGFALQCWAGLQMATSDERPYLALMLPAAVFFPGLVCDDAVLSGNAAYILYGLMFAAAVPGWRRGRWVWFYAAVLLASICKAPLLTLLALPILVGRRQWLPASLAGVGGLALFALPKLIWPELFRDYMLAVRLQFDFNHDFGFGPAGCLSRILWHMGRSYSSATLVFYVAFAAVLGVILLVLAWRVRRAGLAPELWVPVAAVGTLLLNPRVMEYDLAAFTVPMLLVCWRVLRWVLRREFFSGGGALDRRIAFTGLAGIVVLNFFFTDEPRWWSPELPAQLIVITVGCAFIFAATRQAERSSATAGR